MVKAPRQDRSKARVDRMLDTFGTLLDEVGFDALTTTMVAFRSQSAVGSFYQFFRNKQEIAEAYGDRLAQIVVLTTLDRLGRAVNQGDTLDLADCLVALHYAMEVVHRYEPGARHLPVKAPQIAQELTKAFRVYCTRDEDYMYSYVLVAVASSAACCKAAFADPAHGSDILGLCQWALGKLGGDA